MFTFCLREGLTHRRNIFVKTCFSSVGDNNLLLLYKCVHLLSHRRTYFSLISFRNRNFNFYLYLYTYLLSTRYLEYSSAHLSTWGKERFAHSCGEKSFYFHNTSGETPCVFGKQSLTLFQGNCWHNCLMLRGICEEHLAWKGINILYILLYFIFSFTLLNLFLHNCVHLLS